MQDIHHHVHYHLTNNIKRSNKKNFNIVSTNKDIISCIINTNTTSNMDDTSWMTQTDLQLMLIRYPGPLRKYSLHPGPHHQDIMFAQNEYYASITTSGDATSVK